ncbi:Alkaline phosphatase H [Purpureocillium lavendulum]|uniref:Alkaline phosphatase H n=1 Tax=Purpureocillium lavendulum TaxID=1247861 RepID=A0AB34FHD0_9HYPO|nr:Alkaline phosphatase H [Purpureocillium lavendulum]
MTKTRLRAKTGCFTCTLLPSSSDEMLTANQVGDAKSNAARRETIMSQLLSLRPPMRMANRAPRLGHSPFESSIEAELIYHFLNHYFPTILLPTCNKTQFKRSQSEVLAMMLQCESVKHAVLACCASNKSIIQNDNRYQPIALQYYYNAVQDLNQSLVHFQPARKGPGYCLLTTVIFLYVHDLWSVDGSADPRKHVIGAIKLLDLLSKDGTVPIPLTKGMNRCIVESVLYQAFFLSIRQPFAPDFHIDPQFITRAEGLLAPENTQDWSFAATSPVLGVPTSLYRLIVNMVNFQNSPAQQSSAALSR